MQDRKDRAREQTDLRYSTSSTQARYVSPRIATVRSHSHPAERLTNLKDLLEPLAGVYAGAHTFYATSASFA